MLFFKKVINPSVNVEKDNILVLREFVNKS